MKNLKMKFVRRALIFVCIFALLLFVPPEPVSAVSAPTSNYKLTTAKLLYCFDNMGTKGVQEKLANVGNYDTVICHWQGYQKYGSTAILDRDVLSGAGRIVTGTVGGSKTEYTPYTFSKHNGGFQTIGNYLLTPSNDGGNTYISMYQIVGSQLNKKPWSMNIPKFEAGSVAVTEYESGGTAYYLMMLGSTKGYRVYRANAQAGSDYISIENAEFTLMKEIPLTKELVEYQGFGLVTSTDNNVYIIGPYSDPNLTSYTDYLYLQQLNTSDWTVSNLRGRKHLYNNGGPAGATGVHFRYGSGVQIFQNGFEIYATERNRTTSTGNLMTNYWPARFN